METAFSMYKMEKFGNISTEVSQQKEELLLLGEESVRSSMEHASTHFTHLKDHNQIIFDFSFH